MTKIDIYVLIQWESNPIDTHIIARCGSEEEIYEVIREQYREFCLDRVMEDYNCSEKEANKIIDEMSIEYLDGWRHDQDMIIERVGQICF